MPDLEPPSNRYVLIQASNVAGGAWYRAIRTRLRGRAGERWKICDYLRKGGFCYPHKDFQPEDWKELSDAPQEKSA